MFKDQEDYIKVLTDDNIINVIGTKGSGKTTSSLKYIDLSDFVTEHVTNMDSMFEYCTSLTSINFGNYFDTKKVIQENISYEEKSIKIKVPKKSIKMLVPTV